MQRISPYRNLTTSSVTYIPETVLHFVLYATVQNIYFIGSKVRIFVKLFKDDLSFFLFDCRMQCLEQPLKHP